MSNNNKKTASSKTPRGFGRHRNFETARDQMVVTKGKDVLDYPTFKGLKDDQKQEYLINMLNNLNNTTIRSILNYWQMPESEFEDILSYFKLEDMSLKTTELDYSIYEDDYGKHKHYNRVKKGKIVQTPAVYCMNTMEFKEFCRYSMKDQCEMFNFWINQRLLKESLIKKKLNFQNVGNQNSAFTYLVNYFTNCGRYDNKNNCYSKNMKELNDKKGISSESRNELYYHYFNSILLDENIEKEEAIKHILNEITGVVDSTYKDFSSMFNCCNQHLLKFGIRLKSKNKQVSLERLTFDEMEKYIYKLIYKEDYPYKNKKHLKNLNTQQKVSSSTPYKEQEEKKNDEEKAESIKMTIMTAEDDPNFVDTGCLFLPDDDEDDNNAEISDSVNEKEEELINNDSSKEVHHYINNLKSILDNDSNSSNVEAEYDLDLDNMKIKDLKDLLSQEIFMKLTQLDGKIKITISK